MVLRAQKRHQSGVPEPPAGQIIIWGGTTNKSATRYLFAPEVSAVITLLANRNPFSSSGAAATRPSMIIKREKVSVSLDLGTAYRRYLRPRAQNLLSPHEGDKTFTVRYLLRYISNGTLRTP